MKQFQFSVDAFLVHTGFIDIEADSREEAIAKLRAMPKKAIYAELLDEGDNLHGARAFAIEEDGVDDPEWDGVFLHEEADDYHSMRRALEAIRDVPANHNSDPDVMAAALDYIADVAHAGLECLPVPAPMKMADEDEDNFCPSCGVPIGDDHEPDCDEPDEDMP